MSLIILEVGDTGYGINAVQSIALLGGPTGGTFTLTYSAQTTSALPYNASAATIQAALQALSTIGVGNISVIAPTSDPALWEATFIGLLAQAPTPAISGSGASLTGGTTPSVGITQTVVGTYPAGLLAQNIALIWDSFTDKNYFPRLQELYAKLRCIDIVAGSVRESIDVTLQSRMKARGDQRLSNLLKMRELVVDEIEKIEKNAGAYLGSAQIGTLTNVYPIPAPTEFPVALPIDGNDPNYHGSPYYGQRYWRP